MNDTCIACPECIESLKLKVDQRCPIHRGSDVRATNQHATVCNHDGANCGKPAPRPKMARDLPSIWQGGNIAKQKRPRR